MGRKKEEKWKSERQTILRSLLICRSWNRLGRHFRSRQRAASGVVWTSSANYIVFMWQNGWYNRWLLPSYVFLCWGKYDRHEKWTDHSVVRYSMMQTLTSGTHGSDQKSTGDIVSNHHASLMRSIEHGIMRSKFKRESTKKKFRYRNVQLADFIAFQLRKWGYWYQFT